MLIGQRYNRRLACIDVDSNDRDTCEKLLANFPLHVRCYGSKGFKAFFLTDGEQKQSMYKYNAPNGGAVEVFYDNKQVVIPPSLHSDGIFYVWDDDSCTLLTVSYDDLPVIPFAQVETIPTLLGSPTAELANRNLPSQLQYSSDDIADGRYQVMLSHFGRLVKKYNNRPKLSVIITEMLDFDAIHCPKNSFFLHDYNKKRAEIKTNDRSINAVQWCNSVMHTYHKNSGASWAEESEAIPTESIAFNPLIPLEKKIVVEKEEFDLTLIPKCWRNLIDNISTSTNVRHYPIFMSLLANLGATLQSKVKIQPDPHDTEFFQYPNIAICMVASSGSKKSNIISIASRESKAINKELKRANAGAKMDEEQRLQARIEALTKEAKALAAKGEMDASKDAQKGIDELRRELENLDLTQTKWITEMASIQKITLDAKNNQDNGLFFILDEFKQIQALLRKKGNEEARAFFMKGVDGDKDYSYSTLARGDDYIEKHRLSILTSIQPDVLNFHIQDLHNPRSLENDGFWQRFTFCSFGPLSTDMSRPIDYNKYVNEYQLFRKSWGWRERTIHIAPECQHTYQLMRHDIRRRAAQYEGMPIGSFLSKHEGLLCKIALWYEFLLNDGQETKNISLDALKMAERLLHYMAYDTKEIFKASQDALKTEDLDRVVSLIKNMILKNGETQAQWYNSWRFNGSKTSDISKLLIDLEMRGYVASIQTGKQSKTMIINPLVWTMG